jgi:catechol 2,3-dioxygenase-like lactoylglutathione lyase family enzyme
MVKIKHIALTTSDPGKAATFYKEALDLEEIRRDDKGNVFLSDGEFNMAILKFKTDDDADVGAHGPNFSGIHHIGFYVENLPEQVEKMENAGGKRLTRVADAGTGGLFGAGADYANAEVKFSGPDGVIIDVSGSGWATSA